MAEPHVRLRTFGGLAVDGVGAVSPLASQRKRLAFLAILAAAGAEGVARERLLLLLWPESTGERARSALYQLLHVVRQTFGETSVTGSSELRLDPAIIASDVSEFRAAIGRGDLSAAVQTYRGPFLDAFYVKDAAEFERWTEETRRLLALEYHSALARLARAAIQDREFVKAVSHAERLVVTDPLSARGITLLMEALAGSGDGAAALERGRRYETLVRQELDAGADPGVTALMDKLRASSPPHSIPQVSSAAAEPPATAPTTTLTTAPAKTSARRPRLSILFAGYALVLAAVALVTQAAVVVIGLPEWVVAGASIVMLIGVPVLAVTASWRRALRVQSYAMGAFVAAVAGVMLLRVYGLGPAASLVGAGRLKASDTLVVAEFNTDGTDSTLGRALADAVRADLRQSGAVHVLSDQQVIAGLRRMRRAPDQRLLLPVAQELAQRQGVRAIVDGAVKPLGSGYLIMLRLVTADSLLELANYHRGANSPEELVATLGSLTRELRGRIGESLRRIQASPRLSFATTSSLPALEAYSKGRRELYALGRTTQFVQLMHEAIALDSNFAFAYAGLATELENHGGTEDEISHLLEKAYALRDHLPEIERLGVEAGYCRSGPVEHRDSACVRKAMLSLLSLLPNNVSLLNNLAASDEDSGNLRAADSTFRLAVALRPVTSTPSTPLSNLAVVLLNEERLTAAESLMHAPANQHSFGPRERALLFMARDQLDSAVRLLTPASANEDTFDQEDNALSLRTIFSVRGQLRDADHFSTLAAASSAKRGAVGSDLQAAIARSRRRSLVAGDRDGALQILDSLVASGAVERLPFLDRPYSGLTSAYTNAGRVDKAHVYLAQLEKQSAGDRDLRKGQTLREARADVAIAERRWDDAIRESSSALGRCLHCLTIRRAAAWDGRGNADSALALYERFAKSAQRDPKTHATMDEFALPAAWRRIGELSEARGDAAAAAGAYEHFVNMWKDADLELQPQLRDVRRRITRLQSAAHIQTQSLKITKH